MKGLTEDRAAGSDEELALGEGFTDAELTALALGADPEVAPDPEAMPIDVYLGQAAGLLPDWYMPAVMTRRISRGPRFVVLVVIGAFLLIEAFGLCSTYGQIPFH